MTVEIRDTVVAVTGGCGFLGSHLCDHLIEDRGCRVVCIDNLCAGRREFLHPDAVFVYADITQSEEYLRKVFVTHGVRFVMSYAAHPYVPDSYARPSQVCNVNFHGAMNVINAAESAGAAGILQVSSAEVYGTGKKSHYVYGEDPEKINESDPVTPHSTYGASKAAIDFYCQCRWREARTPVVALRQFNCLGERETHPYVVPEILGQLSKQVTFGKYTPGGWPQAGVVRLGNNSSRDFLYAKDAVRSAVLLLERSVQERKFGEVYNLGSESSIKVYDLARLVGKVMGFDEVVVEEEGSRKRAWEIWSLTSDNSKINALIGKQPVTPLDEAIRRTVADYKARGGKWCWE